MHNYILTYVSPYVIINYGDTKEVIKTSPRTGRPTTDPKTHETRIRMSDEDMRLLEYCVKETGLTKAEIIRQGIREVYAKLEKK